MSLSLFTDDVEARLKAASQVWKLRIVDLSEEGLLIKLMAGPVYETAVIGFLRMMYNNLFLSMPTL